MARLGSFLICLGALLALAPAPSLGQSIRVRVLTAESRQPISTAFVSLMDEDGNPLKHTLTNPQGRALLSPEKAGTYRLRAQMFGRGTAWSPPIHIGGDAETSYLFELAVEAIPLAGIRAESEGQCRIRPQDGLELARVWEEVRKALVIQTWTDETGLFFFQIRELHREMHPGDRTVVSENHHDYITTAKNPIQSLPLEDLMRDGFIRDGGNGMIWYSGPDASILLSDLFLNGHCFRLAQDQDRPGDIGLAFEPVTEEGTPDIEGTLWLDRESAHLKELEFVYTNAPDLFTQGVAGGRVEFERLPDGAWIVRRWWIQMPSSQYELIRGRRRLTGIRQTGGEVRGIIPMERAHNLPQTPPGSSSPLVGASTAPTLPAATCDSEGAPPSSSPLVGTVWATPLGQPIPGARVVIRWRPDDALGQAGLVAASEELQTFTDREGRFRFCGVPTDRMVMVRASLQEWVSDPANLQLEEGPFTVLDLELDMGGGAEGRRGPGVQR